MTLTFVFFVFFVLFSFTASPSVLWYCWLGLLTCKNRLPCNLYCVGGDVKHCLLTHSLSKYTTIRYDKECLFTKMIMIFLTNVTDCYLHNRVMRNWCTVCVYCKGFFRWRWSLCSSVSWVFRAQRSVVGRLARCDHHNRLVNYTRQFHYCN